MADALRVIREQLGPEALILGTRKTKNAKGEPTLEITAAVKDDEPATRPVAEASIALPQPSKTRAQPAAQPATQSTALPDILAQHGLADDLIAKIAAALPGLASAGFNEAEGLEMLLAKMLAFKPVEDILKPAHAHLFIGPPGAGKTTLVAKIAVHNHRNGRKTGILSLDDQKIAGFEPLAITAETLGDTAHLLASVNDLKAAARSMGPRHMLLVDTPGLNPYQPQAFTMLKQRLDSLGIPATGHLVVPADMNAADMAALPVACHRFNPASLIVTRLDCTTRYGALVNTAAHSGLPLGVASHSGNFSAAPLALTAAWLAQGLAALPKQPWEFTS